MDDFRKCLVVPSAFLTLQVVPGVANSMGWMSEVLLHFMGQENSPADGSSARCQGDTQIHE